MFGHEHALHEFLNESHDSLDVLDREVGALCTWHGHGDRTAAMMRATRMLRSTAGFLGFTRVATIAGAGEALSAQLREGRVAPHGEIASALAQMVDVLRKLLFDIELGNREPDGDDHELIAKLSPPVTHVAA